MTDPVRSHGFTALGPVHEGLARLKGWKAHGVAALLGAIGALAFAPFHITPILILSFCGLVWMMDGARGYKKWGKATFARGLSWGFGFFLISQYWLAFPFLVDPEKTAVFLFMPLILMPLGMGLITGLGMLIAATFWSASPSRILIFSIGVVLAEFIRGYLFGGFPWNLTGTSWLPGGAMSQLASLGGVYWLSLLTAFMMAAPAALVDTRDNRSVAIRLVPSLVAVVLAGGSWAWGAQRLSTPTEFTETNVTMMDAGVPQRERLVEVDGRIYANGEILTQYITMLNTVPREDNEILVWPEASLPIRVLDEPRVLDPIIFHIGNRPLILGSRRLGIKHSGSLREEGGTQQERVEYNSMMVLDQSSPNAPVAIYDKHRLVPFGELPAERIIPFGKYISGVLPAALQEQAKNGFEPGDGPDNVNVDELGIPVFTALVCYEGLFPEIPRSARPRSDWIVLISDDSWFGVGMGPAQHYAQNAYRAIESGLPMARVATRGKSAMIDGYGRAVATAEQYTTSPEGWTPVYVKSKLPQKLSETLYYGNGFILLWITIAAFSVAAFALWRR